MEVLLLIVLASILIVAMFTRTNPSLTEGFSVGPSPPADPGYKILMASSLAAGRGINAGNDIMQPEFVWVMDLRPNRSVQLASLTKIVNAIMRQLREHVQPLWGKANQFNIQLLKENQWEWLSKQDPQKHGILWIAPKAPSSKYDFMPQGLCYAGNFRWATQIGPCGATVCSDLFQKFPKLKLFDKSIRRMMYISPIPPKGILLSQVMSHELMEQMENITFDYKMPSGKIVKLRTVVCCDPVTSLTYSIDGIAVSNFVTRKFFTGTGPGAYDYMRVLRKPLDVTYGALAFFNLSTGGQGTYAKGVSDIGSAITNPPVLSFPC